MSNLTELINKTIHDIQFNGCKLSETIIRMQLDNIVACAKLEQTDRIRTILSNDAPNVIGDMITEPSLTPEQMVKGEWYLCKFTDDTCEWLFKFKEIKNNSIHTFISTDKDILFRRKGFLTLNNLEYIRPATKEEVLKYFPDETFGEPEQVGRWYKCIDGDNAFTEGKWYFSPKNDPLGIFAFIDNNGKHDSWGHSNHFHFDLTNPQLNNPDLDYVNPITN